MRKIILRLCAVPLLILVLVGTTDVRSDDLLNAKRKAEKTEAQRGKNSVETARALQAYGDLLLIRGQKADAVPVMQKVLAIRRKTLGKNHIDTAYTLDQLGQVLESTEGNQAAEPLFREALNIRETALGIDHILTIGSVQHLATNLYGQSRYAEAVPYLRRIATIMEKLLGTHPNTAAMYHILSEACFRAGRFDAGAAAADRALSIRETILGPDHVELVESLNQRAKFYTLKGDFDQARKLAERAISILEKQVATLEKQVGPDDDKFGNAIESLIYVNEFQARYSKALELAQKGLNARETAFGMQDPMALRFLEHAARNQNYLGRYAESERSFRKILEIRELDRTGDAAIATALLGLGDEYSRQGRYQEAEMLFRRSLEVQKRVYGATHFTVAGPLSRLGRSLREQGKYAEAETALRQGIELIEKALGNHFLTAIALEDLADVYDRQDKVSDAASIYERTIRIKQATLGEDHPQVAFSLGASASLFWKLGRAEEAEAARRRQVAINLAVFGPDHDSTASSYGGLASIQMARERWEDALANFALATDILIRRSLNQLPSPTHAAPSASESEIGQNSATFNNHVHAVYWAPIKVPAMAVGDRSATAEKTFELAQWAQLSDTTTALSQMSLRASNKDEQLASRVRENQDLAAAWRVADEQRSTLLAKGANVDPSSPAMSARQRLVDIERRLAESSDWLRVHFPEYAELSRPLAVSASETGKLLRNDEALVLFSLTAADCFVWVITPEKIHWVRLEVPLQSLIDMVVGLRQQLAGGRFNLNLAYGVYRAVFGPIEEQLAGKHLLIVPNGILTSLPLHLLVTTKPELTDEALSERYRHASWMIKRHAITMLPSVSALKSLRQRSASSDATQPYLGIGNPLLEGRNKDDRRAWILKRCSDLKSSPPVVLASTSASPDGGVSAVFRGGQADVDEIRRLEPLPETVAELCAVAESFGRGDDAVFLGNKASETNIRQLSRDHVLANARVVHFATHGLVAGEMHGLAEPALVVSPPSNEKSEVSSENDGLLTASEIAQLDLNADWVVLSACNTAAGNATGAEALSGLARAFFYAGTRALLVSHWMVNTEAAVKLMVGTFSNLGRDPHIGRAEALRRAMIDMIESGAAHETHPRYWAPFVIVGEGSAQ